MKHLPVRCHPSRLLSPALLAGLACLTAPASGQATEDFKLLPTDGSTGARFGSSTAISNGIVAIGSAGDDQGGAGAGAAYLFDGATGLELRKLLPADAAPGDEFGFSIAIGDGTVVVGALGDDDNGPGSGSAYLFDVATGVQLHKLTPSDGAAGDEFGFAVAIDDGVVVVGAKRDDDNGVDSGSLYLFDSSTGAEIRKITPVDGATHDNFGEAVDVDGGVIAVGAHGDDDLGPLSGSAYLFDVSSGAQIAKLLALDGGTNDFFGQSIAIDAGTVVVGAWADSIFFDHSGSAYLFDAATGTQITKLVPADGHDRDHFGISVAIDAGTIVIGADGDDDTAFEGGSAYLYDASSAAMIEKLLASDGASFDELGTSLAIGAGIVVAGTPRRDDNGDSSGAAYVFGFGSCGSTRNYCVSTPNSSGAAAIMGSTGSTSVLANDLVLLSDPCPPSEFGVFFHGPGQVQVPFGDGFRCVGGPLVRTTVVQVDPGGEASFELDLASAPGVEAGATRSFQFWFRDPTGPGGSGFNLSDGLEITFCD